MFHYLETREDIARAQRQLEATVRRGFSQIAVRDIGYPGGRERRARVATDGHYWFWSRDHRASSVFTPRRLNWFGVLSQKSGVSITVEVNTVYKARNDRAAGFFARDTDTGIVYFFIRVDLMAVQKAWAKMVSLRGPPWRNGRWSKS